MRGSLFARVAAKVGVTPASVTLAMQDSPSISMETKERVFWASRQLRYRQSRIREKQHLCIAAIICTTGSRLSLSASGNEEIWEGLSRRAEKDEIALHTYYLELIKPHRLQYEDLPILLRRDQVDGVVVLGEAFPSLLSFLRKARIPTVVGSNFDMQKAVDQVRIDLIHGAKLLAEKLIGRGHRRIGFLTGAAGLLVHQQLYRGYEEVMREHGLLNRGLVRLEKTQRLRGLDPARSLLAQRPGPTAIFTTHWHAALQVALAATAAGIPADSGFEIATCGRDESVDYLYPLVRLNLHAERVGTTAFDRLMELHQHPDAKPKRLAVQCSLDLPSPNATK